jgi:hypothetical protein
VKRKRKIKEIEVNHFENTEVKVKSRSGGAGNTLHASHFTEPGGHYDEGKI